MHWSFSEATEGQAKGKRKEEMKGENKNVNT